MHPYSPAKYSTNRQPIMTNINSFSRETAFDPLNYEFDAETMIEPFTYFHHGPGETRRKLTEYSSPTLAHLSWLTTHHNSALSSPDESPQSYFSPVLNEPMNTSIRSKTPQNLSQTQQNQQSSYPKTICRHCKSHNMPECLYTSHSMYDESGAIFCPVLKKCHCATCIRVGNSTNIRDDDSDDDVHIRLPTNSADYPSFFGAHSRTNSYRMTNNNNF